MWTYREDSAGVMGIHRGIHLGTNHIIYIFSEQPAHGAIIICTFQMRYLLYRYMES